VGRGRGRTGHRRHGPRPRALSGALRWPIALILESTTSFVSKALAFLPEISFPVPKTPPARRLPRRGSPPLRVPPPRPPPTAANDPPPLVFPPVDGGERAVIFDRVDGVKKETKPEGTHLLIPWLQRPIVMDIRTRPRSISSVTGTKDLQMVNLTLRVLSRPRVEALDKIYSNLGEDWDERVLPSIVNEVLKSTAAQYDAESLLTKREQVSRQVREALRARAEDFNIILDDVAITHLSYGADFSRAIEMKQVAQQDAERTRYLVLKADQERMAAVIRAEGEAEAARLISEATRAAGPALLDVRRIQASREIAKTLGRSRNVAYLPQGQQTLLAIQ